MFKAAVFKIETFSYKLSKWNLQGRHTGLEKLSQASSQTTHSFLLVTKVQMTHVFLTHEVNCSANNVLGILLVYYQMDKKNISAMQIVTPKSQFHLLGFCAKTEENSGYFGAAQIYWRFQTGLCSHCCVPLSVCPHYCCWQFCVLCIRITYYFSMDLYFSFFNCVILSDTIIWKPRVSCLAKSPYMCLSDTSF